MLKESYNYLTIYYKRTNKDFVICEESEDYKIKNPHNMHDKLFRDLLGDKKELSILLKEYLNIDVSSKDLKKYNSSFITNKYESKEADIVYKLKNKNVFFLIEHQSSVDNSMPFRILNYNTEIIRDTIDLDYYKRQEYIYAKVIPIVVYTGGRKWNVSKKFSKQQAIYRKT